MENGGGKRKRVGLSLKSFKKPALNYVEKQPVGKRLEERPSDNDKLNSRLEKFDWRSAKQIETSISETRMKLLSLMPRYSNWNNINPLPLNPLMKSLTESKSEMIDQTNDIYNTNNNSTKDKIYIDLPKLGMHYISQKIKTQLVTCYVTGENDMKVDELKRSEIEVISSKEDEWFDHNRSQREDKNNAVYEKKKTKQALSTCDVNPLSLDDEMILKGKSPLQKSRNVLESTVKDFDGSSQNRSFIEKGYIDLTRNCSNYGTNSKEMQERSSQGKPPYRNKDISKFNSFSKTTRKNLDEGKKVVNKLNNDNRRIRINYNKERNLHRETSARKPVFLSKNFSKSNTFGGEDQYSHTKNNMTSFSQASKNHSVYPNSCTTSHKQEHKQTERFNDKPRFSRENSLINVRHRGHQDQASQEFSDIKKDDPRHSNLCTTVNKQTYLKTNKKTSVYEHISKMNTSSTNLTTSGGDYRTLKDVDGGLGSDEDLFGSDDELDELLAKSVVEDMDYNGNLGTQGGKNDFRWIDKDLGHDNGNMEGLLGSLGNEMDDDALVACCDEVTSPTISIRPSGSGTRRSNSLRSEMNSMSSKGMKRKLNFPNEFSKVKRSNVNSIVNAGFFAHDTSCNKTVEDRIQECPFCAKDFHSGFSKGDIDQHIAMCCSNEDIGNDDAFW